MEIFRGGICGIYNLEGGWFFESGYPIAQASKNLAI